MSDSTAPRDAALAAYEHAACGLLTLGKGGAIERANATVAAWLGTTASALVGRRFQDLLTVGAKLFHHTHWLPLLQMQGSIAEVQLEIVGPESRAIPVLVNAVQTAPDVVEVAVFMAGDRRKYERELLLARRRAEEALGLAQAAQAARARAEARLRLALESAELRVWSVQLPEGVRRYDPGVARLIGLPDGTQVDEATYVAHIHPDDRQREAAALSDALAGNQYSVEVRLLGSDGVERIVRSTGRAFFDEQGVATEFSGLLEDVTERRRNETALHEREREAKQRATFAEQLVGIVSHDLRNPLSAILMASHILKTAELGAHARTVERLAAAGQRANRMITDLLDFTLARLGSGLPTDKKEIELHRVVADTIDELRLASPGRAIEHRHVGEGTGAADPDRIAQVVTNLVGNALAYGNADEPVVVTSAIDPNALEIVVHNGGAPIPAEVKELIFEPMRRGMDQVQRGSRSVGLGLYIVREIARAHGGNVFVHSAAGEGTTFRFVLPRSRA